MVEINDSVNCNINKAITIKILEINLSFILILSFADGKTHIRRSKTCSNVSTESIAGSLARRETVYTHQSLFFTKDRMREGLVHIEAIMEFTIATFPYLIGHPIAIDIYKCHTAFIGRIGMAIRSTCTRCCWPPASANHYTTSNGISPGGSSAKKRQVFVEMSNFGFYKLAIIVYTSCIGCNTICIESFFHIIIVVETLCSYYYTFTVVLVNARKKCFPEGSFFIMDCI